MATASALTTLVSPNPASRRSGATPSAVVRRTDLLELLAYEPTAPCQFERPVLIVSPHANAHDLVDLAPGRSLVAYLVAAGHRVFVAGWVAPTSVAAADRDLADHVDELDAAVDAVLAETGAADLNLCGVRDGGITTAVLAGRLAAVSDERVASVSLLGSTFGWPAFDAVDAEPRAAIVDTWVEGARARKLVSGRDLTRLIATIGHDHERVHEPEAAGRTRRGPFDADLLAWDRQATVLPAELFADLAAVVSADLLARPGGVMVGDVKVDLGAVSCDVYVAGADDRWSTWQSCYRAARLFGGASRFVLGAGVGAHALLSGPDAEGATFRTNELTADDADAEAWLAGSTETATSWWSDWAAWLDQRGGDYRAV